MTLTDDARVDRLLEPLRLDDVTAVPHQDVAAHCADRVVELGRQAPLPGEGATLVLWEVLSRVAQVDLSLARVAEPHLDALAILSQAGMRESAPDRGLLGVYAAEGPGHRLVARTASQGVTLSGSKPWCSLAHLVDAFLVTAWVDESRRGLFLVRRDQPGSIEITPTPWVSRGLAGISSPTLRLEGAEAVAVGDPGWYLQRPGFAWGGLGVSAIWWGGALAVARELVTAARRREPDQIALMHIGALDAALHSIALTLRAAAQEIDDEQVADPFRLFLQVRQVVRWLAEDVLQRVGRALGPGPVTADEAHARRVADLTVYLRQEHGERDQAALGRQVLAAARPW